MLGRFLSADTIVPSASDPQSLNRFSYTRNNPLKYIDPSGHKECEKASEGGTCESATNRERDWAQACADIPGFCDPDTSPGHLAEVGLFFVIGMAAPEIIQLAANLYTRAKQHDISADIPSLDQANNGTNLYHATNTAGADSIQDTGIDLNRGRLDGDFNPSGQRGFYTTNDLEQAQAWATHRFGDDGAIVKYTVPEGGLDMLNGKTFNGANSEWEAFVQAGRDGTLNHNYDFVEGPYLANPYETPPVGVGHQIAIFTDRAVELFNSYFSGILK